MRPEQPIRAAALSLLVAAALGCADSGRLRGAVLVVLDTLRADRLSAYGYPRQTSPVLDGLAARGVLFEQAISSSSWTLPAMISLLSGRYATAETFSHPSDSGVLRLDLAETAVGGWALGVATGTIVPGPTFPLPIEFDLVHADFGTTRFTGVLVDGRLVGRLNGSLASYVFVDALVTFTP